VTFSSVGCQCAGILVPAAQRNRITNGAPSEFMSPATDAKSQPLIIGDHFRSAVRTIPWPVLASFFSCAKPAAHSSTTVVTVTPRACLKKSFIITPSVKQNVTLSETYARPAASARLNRLTVNREKTFEEFAFLPLRFCYAI